MARASDWKLYDDGRVVTLARFVIFDDGSYRLVHLTREPDSVDLMAANVSPFEGLSPEQARDRLERSHELYCDGMFWATKPYEISDHDAMAGDIQPEQGTATPR